MWHYINSQLTKTLSCHYWYIVQDDPKTRQEFLLCKWSVFSNCPCPFFATSYLITKKKGKNNNTLWISDSCHLSLDPNTACVNLLVSEGNSRVAWIKKPQNYTHHPERFTEYDQVLCTEGLTGVCYWEVEWQGPRVEVAVCHKGVELVGSSFGYTDQSWCISLSNSGCTFWHNEIKTKIYTSCSSTVGVYLNHKAGNLSFYSVSGSDQMTLLHRVQTTFSQPLYPGFMVSRGCSVRIISPN